MTEDEFKALAEKIDVNNDAPTFRELGQAWATAAKAAEEAEQAFDRAVHAARRNNPKMDGAFACVLGGVNPDDAAVWAEGYLDWDEILRDYDEENED